MSPGVLFCGLKFCPGRLAKNTQGGSATSLKDVGLKTFSFEERSWRHLKNKTQHRDRSINRVGLNSGWWVGVGAKPTPGCDI
jgi:hypothetical protein